MTSLEDCNFEIYITILLRMTGFGGDCYSLNLVIPTEKPQGFDEESTVCTTKSSWIRSINCRSSRRSFHSLLKMTSLTNCHSSDTVIPIERGTSDEESLVGTSQSNRIRSINCRFSRRSFHSLLRMTSLTNCHSSDTVIPTERGTRDEESRVCTLQSSEIRSTHCRSSRHSLTLIPQDDGFGGL